MKRLLRVLLSVILVLQICVTGVRAGSVAAAEEGTEKAETGAAGFWKLTEMKSGEETVTREQLASYEKMGAVIYMEFREDGTFLISGVSQEPMSGTWDEKAVMVQGNSIPYTLDKNEIRIEVEENHMVFERVDRDTLYGLLGYKEGILDETVKYSEEEQVLLDTEDIQAKITGYEADLTGFAVKVHCENKSGHKVIVSAPICVLNKYSINPNWALALAAGESKDTSIVFSPIELEKCGISSVDELILRLKVVDSENWTTMIENEQFTFYPTGKKAEEIRAEDRKPAEKEQIVLDNDVCTFILQGAAEEPNLGYGISCYVENKSDIPLTFLWSGSSVNGTDAASLYAVELLPGTRGYSKGYFLKATLEEKEIKVEDIREIRATLSIYNREGEFPESVASQEFTYTP